MRLCSPRKPRASTFQRKLESELFCLFLGEVGNGIELADFSFAGRSEAPSCRLLWSSCTENQYRPFCSERVAAVMLPILLCSTEPCADASPNLLKSHGHYKEPKFNCSAMALCAIRRFFNTFVEFLPLEFLRCSDWPSCLRPVVHVNISATALSLICSNFLSLRSCFCSKLRSD